MAPTEGVRRRSPDMKELPVWLAAPISRLVRSRPCLEMLSDGRGRMQFDWDSAACAFLGREYWEGATPECPTWLSCCRLWASARPQGDLTLVSTVDDLARSVVTLVVAETIAHRRNDRISVVDVRTRRHINTTAGRQREDADGKLKILNVVHFALARFDYDTLLNKLAHRPRNAQQDVAATFATLHNAVASGTCESTQLRTMVVDATRTMRQFVRRAVFVPWHAVMQPALHAQLDLELAARAFANGLPVPDVAFLASPTLPSRPFAVWLEHLCEPQYTSRWSALTKFWRRRPDAGFEHARRLMANIIVYVVLYAAAGERFHLLRDAIECVAEAQARCSQKLTPTFRDLFQKALDLTAAPTTSRIAPHIVSSAAPSPA